VPARSGSFSKAFTGGYAWLAGGHGVKASFLSNFYFLCKEISLMVEVYSAEHLMVAQSQCFFSFFQGRDNLRDGIR
jgi:hypothetical protein